MESTVPTQIESKLNQEHESSQSLNEFISSEEFQDVIRKRKEEMKATAKQTIKHDKELIAERKSVVENDSLLTHFPKEILDLIMSQLACLPDVCQCILFPYVMQQFLESSARNMCSHNSINFNQATTLRRVCKSSKNTVDRFYEENILFCLQGGVTSVPTYSVQFLKNEGCLDQAVQLFCTGPMEERAKKFFLRSLEFKVGFEFDWNTQGELRSLEECFADFSFKTMRLLEVVGDQIWHFEFKIWETEVLGRNGIPLSQILMILKSMVSNMPNLKWLEIKMGYSRPRSSIDCETKEDEQFAEFARSFPTLKDLEKLDFSCEGDHPLNIEILTSVLRANPQIKTLFFSPTSINEETKRNYFHLLFESLPPMLPGFRLNRLDPISMQFLQPLKKLYSALSTLTVCFDGSVSVGAAFSFINCFPALQNLAISFEDPRIGRGTIPMLKLSNLRKCDVSCWKGKMDYTEGGENVIIFFALQFLMHCKKLQSLRWTNWFTDIHLRHFLLDYEYCGNMIDFKGGHWDLNRSNIWKVFPELRDINVRLEFTKNDPNREEFDSRSTQESSVLEKAYRKFREPEVKRRTLESSAN